MARSTFKTMYLVSKSDLENRNDNNAKKNFKLSLQNRDICDGGMSVSVKPIKTRVRKKQKVEKTTNVQLDVSDSEDGDENILALPAKKIHQYPYARFKAQSTESIPQTKQQLSSSGFRSGNYFKYLNNDDGDKMHDIEFENSSPLNVVEYKGSDLRNNEDNPSPPNIKNYHNKDHKDNDADSTVNPEYDSIPSNIEDYISNDKSEKIGQRSKRVKYDEKVKGFKIRRLQKRHSKKFKKKFLDNQRSQNISRPEELPLNQNENQIMLQGENRDASEDEDSQKRYINKEHETEKVDDNQINNSAPNFKKKKNPG